MNMICGCPNLVLSSCLQKLVELFFFNDQTIIKNSSIVALFSYYYCCASIKINQTELSSHFINELFQVENLTKAESHP